MFLKMKGTTNLTNPTNGRLPHSRNFFGFVRFVGFVGVWFFPVVFAPRKTPGFLNRETRKIFNRRWTVEMHADGRRDGNMEKGFASTFHKPFLITLHICVHLRPSAVKLIRFHLISQNMEPLQKHRLRSHPAGKAGKAGYLCLKTFNLGPRHACFFGLLKTALHAASLWF